MSRPAGIICAAVLLFLTHPLLAGEPPYRHYAAVIHVHSTVSSGEFKPAEVVDIARRWKIPIVVFSDHQRHVVKYGLWPYAGFLKKSGSLNSVEDYGVEKYLAEINRLQEENPDMVIIAGMEVVPYYYYTGGYFSGDLTVNDFHRHMVVLGLDNAGDYNALPTIHGPASTRFFWKQVPAFLIVLVLLAAAVVLFLKAERRRVKVPTLVLAVFFAAGAYNNLPVANTRFDQYSGSHGAVPYQDVIDAVAERGGIVLWAHPEAYEPTGPKKVGPARFITPPYPEMIRRTEGYTAFAALYGDRITFTSPGGIWDDALEDYCAGVRKSPPFAYGERDFHDNATRFNLHQTKLLLKELSRVEVLAAMREGRMYAMQAPRREEVDVELEAGDGEGWHVVMGGTLECSEARVTVRVRCKRRVRLDVEIISDGKVLMKLPPAKGGVLHSFNVKPAEGRTTYVRVTVTGSGKKVLSNPVFIKDASG